MEDPYQNVYKSLSVEAEAELILKLGALAKKEGKSFSEYVRCVLWEHIQEKESRAPRETSH